jgi:hypothetical protein
VGSDPGRDPSGHDPGYDPGHDPTGYEPSHDPGYDPGHEPVHDQVEAPMAASVDRWSVPAGVVDEANAALDADNPFTLDISAKRAAEVAAGTRDFTLETALGFDIDEPLPVGDLGIKREEAVARALDPHNRTLLDSPTNRRTKHLRTSPDAAAKHRGQLESVSVDDDPVVILTRRFSEVVELRQVFDEAVGRVRNIQELGATAIKARVNANIRDIIQNGRSPAGLKVRDALHQLGFEFVSGRGIVAVR